MAMHVRPCGARLRVKVLSMELRTEGGIIMPATASSGPDTENQMQALAKDQIPTLQLAEILEVGEGQWSQDEGRYLGSRFKRGQRILFRCGPHSQIHLDMIPLTVGGKSGELLIQETLVAGVFEGDLLEVEDKRHILELASGTRNLGSAGLTE